MEIREIIHLNCIRSKEEKRMKMCAFLRFNFIQNNLIYIFLKFIDLTMIEVFQLTLKMWNKYEYYSVAEKARGL